jgi:hypothetical protein
VGGVATRVCGLHSWVFELSTTAHDLIYEDPSTLSCRADEGLAGIGVLGSLTPLAGGSGIGGEERGTECSSLGRNSQLRRPRVKGTEQSNQAIG